MKFSIGLQENVSVSIQPTFGILTTIHEPTETVKVYFTPLLILVSHQKWSICPRMSSPLTFYSFWAVISLSPPNALPQRGHCLRCPVSTSKKSNPVYNIPRKFQTNFLLNHVSLDDYALYERRRHGTKMLGESS